MWAQLAARGAFRVAANGPGTPYSACGPGGSRYRVGHVPASAGQAPRPTAACCGRPRWPGRPSAPPSPGRSPGVRASSTGPGRTRCRPSDDRPDPALPGRGDPEHQRVNEADGAPWPPPPRPGCSRDGRPAGSRPACWPPHGAQPRVLGRALVLPLGTGLAFAVMAPRFGPGPVLPAFCYLAGIGVPLAVIDARCQRLPDALTLPSYPVALALLGLAALLMPGGRGHFLRRAARPGPGRRVRPPGADLAGGSRLGRREAVRPPRPVPGLAGHRRPGRPACSSATCSPRPPGSR